MSLRVTCLTQKNRPVASNGEVRALTAKDVVKPVLLKFSDALIQSISNEHLRPAVASPTKRFPSLRLFAARGDIVYNEVTKLVMAFQQQYDEITAFNCKFLLNLFSDLYCTMG